MSGNGNGKGPSFGKLRQRIGIDDALAMQGACLTLDETVPIKWHLRSVHTKQGQRIQHEIQMRALEANLAGGGLGTSDYETSVAGDVELVTALLTRWEGMTDDEGRAVEVSEEAVAAAFDAFPAWRQRALAFVRNEKNYRRPTGRTLAAIEGNSVPASVLG